ncbi:MAG: hypothetical protein ACHQ1G_07600 [Planctomycetota bacterium]
MTTRQRLLAEADRRGCKVEYVPRQDSLPAEVLVDAPDGKSFDGELTQLVCIDWKDALERLAQSEITEGEPE